MTVIDAGERPIRWLKVSQVNNDTTRHPMPQVVENRVYKFHKIADDPGHLHLTEQWPAATRHSEQPKLNRALLAVVV